MAACWDYCIMQYALLLKCNHSCLGRSAAALLGSCLAESRRNTNMQQMQGADLDATRCMQLQPGHSRALHVIVQDLQALPCCQAAL